MVDTTLPLEVKWTSFILLGEGRSPNAAQATELGLGKPESTAGKGEQP